MLDDLKYIHQRDKSDALGIAEKQFGQYLHNFGFTWQPKNKIYEVILVGMGGSGLAGRAYGISSSIEVPFSVLQEYDLPSRVDVSTLLICSSYSGNTEEVISVFNQAFDEEFDANRPMVVVIASGGKLVELAKERGVPYLLLPSGLQPRFTFGYQYRALVEIMASTPLIDNELSLIESCARKLPDHIKEWLPDVPSSKNLAKQIALDIVGKSPVIYAGPKLFPSAYKWKISFNENSKNVAWCNQFPEFNHNEFLGWTSHPVNKPYAPIFIMSSNDHPQIIRRFETTKKMLSGQMPDPIIVNSIGETNLDKLLTSIALGDFVSLYLALLNNIDPTPVAIMEKFKKEIAQYANPISK